MGAQAGQWILVILGFGFLVLVHELGHFLAAKKVGVRVIRFAFGFGPRLFGKQIRGTDYCICLVPCGGYVKLAGGEGEEKRTGAPDEFPSKKPGQRALVLAAGPLMSILVAVPMLFGLYLVGIRLPSSRINQVFPGGGAWNSGLKRGDLVTGIRRADEQSWHDVRLWRELKLNSLLKDKVGDVVVRIDRAGRELSFEVKTDDEGRLGLKPELVGRDLGYVSNIVGHVPKGGPASEAGLVPGTRLLDIGGRRVHTWKVVASAVLSNPGKPLEVRFIPPCATEPRTGTLPVRSEKCWWPGILAEWGNRVGLVRPGFPADRAGVKPDDRIVAVSGRPVATWAEIEQAVLDAGPREIELRVLRAGAEHTLRARAEPGDELADVIGLAPDQYPVVTGFSGAVASISAAAQGVKVGDRLLRLGKLDLANVSDTRLLAGRRAGRAEPLVLEYDRGGEKRQAHLALLEGVRGVADLNPRIEERRVIDPGRPLAALAQACIETWRWVKVAARGLWLLVTFRLSFDLLSGPLMMAAAASYQAEGGVLKFLEFLVIITIHLGVINLVPFPVLDGGHLALLGLEKLRRKPLSEQVMARIMYAGMAALIVLMVFVTWNDISKLLGLS